MMVLITTSGNSSSVINTMAHGKGDNSQAVAVSQAKWQQLWQQKNQKQQQPQQQPTNRATLNWQPAMATTVTACSNSSGSMAQKEAKGWWNPARAVAASSAKQQWQHHWKGHSGKIANQKSIQKSNNQPMTMVRTKATSNSSGSNSSGVASAKSSSSNSSSSSFGTLKVTAVAN